MRLDAVMDESIQITVLWLLMPCSLVDGCQGLRGTCYLSRQGAERNVYIYRNTRHHISTRQQREKSYVHIATYSESSALSL